MSYKDSGATLECWEWCGSVFTGYIRGHEHWSDGSVFSSSVNMIDWKGKKIVVGNEIIHLGASRDELNDGTPDVDPEQEIPW